MGRIKVIITLISIVLCVEGASIPQPTTNDTCARQNVTNGCSNPLGSFEPASAFYNKMFIHVCNKHDVCYTCGKSYGINRTQCDETFLQSMKDICLNVRKRFLLSDIGNYVGNVLGSVAEIAGNALMNPFDTIANSLKSGQVFSDPLKAGKNVLLSPVHSVASLTCGTAAELYYSAVRAAGNSHFVDITDPQCTDPWVRQCLPK